MIFRKNHNYYVKVVCRQEFERMYDDNGAMEMMVRIIIEIIDIKK